MDKLCISLQRKGHFDEQAVICREEDGSLNLKTNMPPSAEMQRIIDVIWADNISSVI